MQGIPERRYLLNTYVEERTCMQSKENNSLSKVAPWIKGICNTQNLHGGRRLLEVVYESSHEYHSMYLPHTFTDKNTCIQNKEKDIISKKKMCMVEKACEVREDTIQEAKAGWQQVQRQPGLYKRDPVSKTN